MYLPLHLVQTICRYISVFCLGKNQMKCTSLVPEDVASHNKYAFMGAVAGVYLIKYAHIRLNIPQPPPPKGVFMKVDES